MTANEELRRLLDERGIEREVFDDFEQTTQWSTYNGAFVYWSRERDGKLLVETTAPTKCSASCTAEQAIAATLGDADATRERQGDAGTCRPCPFCGSTAETVHTLKVVPHEPWWIRCPSCGVTTPKYSSKTDAIAAWNRRTQQAIEASLGMES